MRWLIKRSVKAALEAKRFVVKVLPNEQIITSKLCTSRKSEVTMAKKPSAKQAAARAKFATMVKGKAAKKTKK